MKENNTPFYRLRANGRRVAADICASNPFNPSSFDKLRMNRSEDRRAAQDYLGSIIGLS